MAHRFYSLSFLRATTLTMPIVGCNAVTFYLLHVATVTGMRSFLQIPSQHPRIAHKKDDRSTIKVQATRPARQKFLVPDLRRGIDLDVVAVRLADNV